MQLELLAKIRQHATGAARPWGIATICLGVLACCVMPGSLNAQETPLKEAEIERASGFFGEPPERKVEKKRTPREKGDEGKNVAEHEAEIAPAENGELREAFEQPADPSDEVFLGSIEERCLRVELAFLRRACPLTQEQEVALATKFDKQWLSKVLKGNQIVNGVPLAGRESPSDESKIRASLSRAMSKPLQEILSAEQWTLYEDELQARQQFEHNARAEVLLCLLHKNLRLTQDQLKGIKRSILHNVPNEQLHLYLINTNYLPYFADSELQKQLTPKQFRVYSFMQKISFGFRDENLAVIRQ